MTKFWGIVSAILILEAKNNKQIQKFFSKSKIKVAKQLDSYKNYYKSKVRKEWALSEWHLYKILLIMYKLVYIFIHHFLLLMNLNLVVDQCLDCFLFSDHICCSPWFMVGTRPLPTQSCNRIRDLSFSACCALAMHGRWEAPNRWDEVENNAAVHGGSQLYKIFSKFQTLAERGKALLTKLLNFTSPGPEFLHGKSGASGVPLKGVRLMRSVKRPRSTHFVTLKG